MTHSQKKEVLSVRSVRVVLACLLILLAFASGQALAAPVIAVVPVHGEIEPGLSRFIDRAMSTAEGQNVDAVIVEIGTLGGRVDAALEIRDRIERSNLPTIALVKDRAISAGALITLACDRIFMVPTATIGAAEPFIGSQPAPEKYLSLWRAEMMGTAERQGHDPQLAASMVDKDMPVAGVVEKGKLLTLTAQQAQELQLAEGLVSDRSALLSRLGGSSGLVREIAPTLAESIARAVISPAISTILLSLGFGGIVIELLHPGFGIAGLVSLASWSLFFGGHWLAGLAGLEVILLFVVGLGLLVAEAIVPGFGLMGFGGIAAVIGSIVVAVGGRPEGIQSLLISLVLVALLIVILIRQFGRQGLWQRIILSTQLSTEEGYVSTPSQHRLLLGQEGSTMSPLRPSGIVQIDGQRVNVVSDGDFVPAGTRVRVVRVEGAKVYVARVEN